MFLVLANVGYYRWGKEKVKYNYFFFSLDYVSIISRLNLTKQTNFVLEINLIQHEKSRSIHVQ